MNVAPPTAPSPDEYDPFYAGYIAQVEREDVIALLAAQPVELARVTGGLTEEQARHRYAPGKWSVKEVVGHLADAERVFAYRALRVCRGDATPLPGFDENAYVAAGGADERPLDDLVGEFAAVRAATRGLLESVTSEVWTNRGIANGNPVSLRALAYIIPGHVRHHLGILRERYGLDPHPTVDVAR